MRHVWLIAALAFRCSAYDLTGRIEPPVAARVSLQGVTTPFANSAVSGPDGRFRFRSLASGTYTIAILIPARGEVRQTVELSPGAVDSKGHLDIVLRLDDSRLASEGVRKASAMVSVSVLSIPDRAMKEFEEARRCLSRSDPACASAALRRAVEIAPQFASAWNQLGTLAYQQRRFSDAETNFRRALAADPDAFEPLVNLGGVLLNLGRPNEAVEYNERAVRRRSNDALANSQLGLTCFELNDLDSAEKYLKAAVELDPAHFSHPQLPLAEIYLKRDDRHSAVQTLNSFLEHHPDTPEAQGVRRRIAELSQ